MIHEGVDVAAVPGGGLRLQDVFERVEQVSVWVDRAEPRVLANRPRLFFAAKNRGCAPKNRNVDAGEKSAAGRLEARLESESLRSEGKFVELRRPSPVLFLKRALVVVDLHQSIAIGERVIGLEVRGARRGC